MLTNENKKIIMNEGDFGISLSFFLSNDILITDRIEFRIKKTEFSDELIITKNFTDLEETEDGKFKFDLEFSKEDTKKLVSGNYVYGIKQYRNDKLLNTIVSKEVLEVKKGV